MRERESESKAIQESGGDFTKSWGVLMASCPIVTSLSGTGEETRVWMLRGWAGRGWLLGLSSTRTGLGLAHTFLGRAGC